MIENKSMIYGQFFMCIFLEIGTYLILIPNAMIGINGGEF